MILKGNINYRLIGEIDISHIKEKLELIKDRWNDYDYRQNRYKDHSKTKTIPLIWSENFSSREEHPHYDLFKKDIDNIEQFIRDNVCSTGGLMSAILINLPKNESINRHRDANPIGDKFNRCHRIHIPIQTNPSCLFEIDNEYKNLKEGEVWEINNIKKLHSVSNKGNSDRIHLLLDWDPNLQNL